MSKVFSAIAFFVFALLAARPSFAAGGTCPSGNTTIDPNGNPISLSSLGVTSCFYISKSTGSDTNAGTTEAAPWAHAPGMPSCTGTCAATKPTGGEGFILRGGETWVSSDLGVNLNVSGSSGHPIYYGVDPTWFNSSACGGSWCRPIFNAGSATNSNMWQFQGGNSYVTVDNIEMTGMRNNQNGFLWQGASNMRATQLYIHGWSHTGNQDNVGMFTQCGTGTNVDHNIVDGADSSKNTFNGVFSSCAGTIAYNYFSYLVSGVLANTDIIHDNIVIHTVTSVDGDHCNGVFTFSTASGNGQLIYNNYINNGNSCPGGVVLWFNGNGGGLPNSVNFGFNNVMWGLSSNPMNIGNHATASYGTYYWFNNTVDCSLGGCGGPPGNGYWTIYDNNNHFIPGPLNSDSSSFGGSHPPVCNKGVNGTSGGCTDLTQTEAVANGQGYTSSEAFPYSPASSCTSASCSTVQHGTNLTSTYCSVLSGINATAGTACTKETSAGCAYNTSNHTLSCPNNATNNRPSTGAWDIGAYQFGAGSQVGAPTHLTGSAVTP
jgi:hypothetical protein